MSTGTYFDQTQAIMYLKRVVKSLSCACNLTLLNVFVRVGACACDSTPLLKKPDSMV